MSEDSTDDDEALLVRVPKACELLAVGRTTLYQLIDRSEVDTVHFGRAVRITRRSIESFVERSADRSHVARGR